MELSVYEYMGESKLTSIIPRLLLDVLIADEKAKVSASWSVCLSICLSVYEYMGESKLTSIILRLLLDVLIADEKAKVRR